MQYLLMIYSDESRMTSATPNDMQKLLGAYTAYTQALKEAGAWVAGDALQPTATASTVRIVDGKTQVLDGPYAEAKEQLAGYYLIEAPELDSALEWAARCPGASYGIMEVRPIMVFR